MPVFSMSDEINIGLAISVEGGVLAPAIRAADQRDVRELDDMVQDLKSRAVDGRLHPDEISSGTFTLSNLGMFEVTAFAAIITPPQVAALAIGRPVDRLVVFRRLNCFSQGHDGHDERRSSRRRRCRRRAFSNDVQAEPRERCVAQ